MSQIVNLRQIKKQRARAERQKQAEQNRSKFGRSKAERILQANKALHQKTVLDGHRLDKPDKKS